MNLDQVASQVESASIGLQNPETRKEADEFLNSFAEFPDALLVCKIVLDASQSDLAHFQVSSTIKRRVPRDFFTLSKEDILAFRDYIFQYCLGHPSLPKYTSSTLLQSVATICKFSWLRDGEENTSHFLDSVLTLSLNEEHEKHTTLVFISALLEEFIQNRALQFGLSNDMHRSCKQKFQEQYLLKVFLAVSSILQRWLAAQSSNEIPIEIRIGHIVSKLLEILVLWDFDEREGIFFDDTYGDGNNPKGAGSSSACEFPDEWKPYLTNPEFLDLLFLLHSKLQELPEERAPLDQVLIALSGLGNEQFASSKDKNLYTERFFYHLSDMITRHSSLYELADSYLLTTAEMIDGILTSSSLLELMPIPGLSNFLQLSGEITLKTLHLMLKENEDTCSVEAFEFLIETWANIVRQLGDEERPLITANHGYSSVSADMEAGLRTYVQQLSISLIDTYINVRLEFATQDIYSGLKDRDPYYKDWALYENQLLGIATLARAIPNRIIQTLYTLLEANFLKVQAHFSHTDHNPEDLTLEATFEHIHWLLIICGYVLADSGEGEEACIPASINSLSSNQHSHAVDPVILLPTLIMNMLDFLTYDPLDVKCTLCSPDLTETFFWFIERWTQSYLFPNKDGYIVISKNILEVFGTSSREEAGRVVLDVLLTKIWNNYLMWGNKQIPLSQISKVLLHLVYRKESRLVLFNSGKFSELATSLVNQMNCWVSDANSTVLQSVLLIATGTSNCEVRENLLAVVKKKLEDQVCWAMTVLNERNSLDATNLNQVRNIFEMLHGFALANDSDNCLVLFKCFQNYLPAIIQILSAFCGRPEIWMHVFQFFNSFTKNLDLFEFESHDLDQLRQFSHLLIENYATAYHNILRTSELSESSSETIPELCEALEALCNLSFIDRSLGEGDGHECIKEIVFFGLVQLFPLVSLESLQGPGLSACFYTLIALVAEQFPLNLESLSQDFLASVMSALTFGQESLSYDSAHLAYNVVFIMAVHAFKTQTNYLSTHLSGQLQNVLANLLFRRVNGGLIEPASEVLLVLIIILPDRFQELKEIAISQWAAPTKIDYFRHQFDTLFSVAQRSGNIPPKGRPVLDTEAFNCALMTFLREAYGCLSPENATLST